MENNDRIENNDGIESTGGIEKFNENVKLLLDKKIIIDKIENINKFQNKNTLIDAVKKYDPKKRKTYLNVVFFSAMYDMSKSIKIFTERFVYQLNVIYLKEYSYYHIFLNICFISIVMIISIILYWDNIYRKADKYSRCKVIRDIQEQNENILNPFVYYVVIIEDLNLDLNMDKYAIKLEYNFPKRKTYFEMGDDEYLIKPTANTPAKFKYYDIENMTSKSLDINGVLITTNKFKYITVNSKNEVVKTDIGDKLAKFTREFVNSDNIMSYPIFDINDAYLQSVNQ